MMQPPIALRVNYENELASTSLSPEEEGQGEGKPPEPTA